MRSLWKLLGVYLLVAAGAFSQNWEAGGFAGLGFTTNATITNSAGAVSAGFKPGLIAGALIGSNDYKHLGGEFRYAYRMSDLKLDGGGRDVSFGGHTQYIEFRMLYHFSEGEAHVRPFVSLGGGAAVYAGTGTESSQQPLNNFAALTKTHETKAMLSAAVGVKVRISPHTVLRLEVADQVTPFPSKIITPYPGSSVGGWLHNFAPVVAIVRTF